MAIDNERELLKIYGRARHMFRNDSMVEWQRVNPILKRGEPGVVTGRYKVGDMLEDPTQKFKIGDGIHAWNDLPWWEGPEGIQGITGPTGPTGSTPTITIGTVTTGDPGAEASASITGTSPNFILNLTIPQGPTGPTGPAA
jgi:hypothetical protein